MSAPSGRPRRTSSLERRDPFSNTSVYYNEDDPLRRKLLGGNTRVLTSYLLAQNESTFGPRASRPNRRSSHDEYSLQMQELVFNVESTLNNLREQEDTDGNDQITIEDQGPKNISAGTIGSGGYRTQEIRGNYAISNLLQELTLAKDHGHKVVRIHRARLNENPVDRLSRRIKSEFWKSLERVLDASVIDKAGRDPKDWTDDPRPRIYIPRGCPEQYEYYTQAAKDRPEIRLDVQWLPEEGVTAEYVRDLNNKPGVLALAMKKATINGKETLTGEPFVVPGGRFNELYGWDSYMVSIGLVQNGKIEIAKSMVRNFIFCIQHYGKILNANRSYYLCRSQPPFLTDMALRIFEKIEHQEGALEFLRDATLAAIKEYYSVWMASPRCDPATMLSRYRPDGVGVPPETEPSHFVHVIAPYAKKHDMTFEQFVKAYNAEEVKEPELDEYFLHDRGVRESGHDTTYRLDGKAANLATVDLNSCLYKYERDISMIIRKYFGDHLLVPIEFQTAENRLQASERSSTWDRRSTMRRLRMNKYMWNEEMGMYFDYDTVKKQATYYESVTTFWAMWANVASTTQAASMVVKALPKFEMFGGLVSGTKASLGEVTLDHPNRQWDYPFGWAPQQMLAWGGLVRYGYEEEAQRLAYKWLYMVTKAFVDFNGVVVEKYNVTRELDPHKVEVEYGNQGADFKGVPREGFGWVNASYVYGLTFVNSTHMRRALGTLTPWESFAKATLQRLEDGTIEEVSDETDSSPIDGGTPESEEAIIDTQSEADQF